MHYKEFLSPHEHDLVLNWAIENEANYRPSEVGYGAVSEKARISLQCKELGPCRELLPSKIRPRLPEFARAIGLGEWDIASWELELVAHNEGAFFMPHTDTGRYGDQQVNRLISAVYYFHRQPKGFSGGELRLFDLTKPGAYTDFEPEDNSLLVFPAFVPHEVRRVSCPSRKFTDSRFAINVWAHRKPQ